MKIDGKKVAEEITSRLEKKEHPSKILAVVLVGDDPRSLSFIKQKENTAKKLGVDFRLYKLEASLGNDGLRREVGKISKQKTVGGVVVQLPLPEKINKHYVLNAIPPDKDVDVLSERTLGALYNRRSKVLSPAAETTKEILERNKVDIAKTNFAIVGTGALVGRPIGAWLSGMCKELYILGKGSSLDTLESADVVISGVGKAGIINPSRLKKGAGVIDFGYYYFPTGEVSGDLDSSNEKELQKLSFYTPTPGGTGPILVSKLMENFFTLCES